MTFFKANGLYYAQGEGGSYQVASTLERLLQKLAPSAPPNYLHAAAEVLEPLVGKGKEQIGSEAASA